MADHDSLRQMFEKASRENYRLFYSIAYHILRDAAASEDAVQDGFFKALQSLDRLEDPRAVVPWTSRIVHNAAIDLTRKQKKTALDINDPAVEPAAVNRTGEFEDVRQLLLDEIAELSDNLSSVIRLRFFEGCDIEEISTRLHITPNSTRVRLHRALEVLRRVPRLRKLEDRSEP